MRMMASFFSAYPGRTAVMLLALLLSGVAEGVGLSALLPLLNIAVGQWEAKQRELRRGCLVTSRREGARANHETGERMAR